MPDITICKGIRCDAKATCLRYTAKPNKYRQSYFIETPNINGGCEYYIKHNKIWFKGDICKKITPEQYK